MKRFLPLFAHRDFLCGNSSHSLNRLAAVGFLASCALTSQGQLTVDLPPQQLLPNQSGQTFTINVANTGSAVSVFGVSLYLAVGDGSAGAAGPAITSVNTFTATIFDRAGYAPAEDESINSHLYNSGTTFSDINAPAVSIPAGTPSSPQSTLLATVIVDTTGVAPGVYSYSLQPSGRDPLIYFTSTGGENRPTLADGQLTVVPEPATYALFAGVGCLAVGAIARRNRKVRDAISL